MRLAVLLLAISSYAVSVTMDAAAAYQLKWQYPTGAFEVLDSQSNMPFVGGIERLDLDGDSRPDIVFERYIEGPPDQWCIDVYKSTDYSLLWSSPPYPWQPWGFHGFHDVNADGAKEVIITTPGGDGEGTVAVDWTQPGSPTIWSAAGNVRAIRDVDSDGYDDIIVFGVDSGRYEVWGYVDPTSALTEPLSTSGEARNTRSYPNPSPGVTYITYHMPSSGRADVGVYDVQGAKVRSLVSQAMDPGEYSVVWDGKDDRGLVVPSGTYFVNVCTNGTSTPEKVLVLR